MPRTPDTKKSPDIRFRKDSARAAAPADGSSLTANEFCQVNEELDYERHFDARHDSAENRQDASGACSWPAPRSRGVFPASRLPVRSRSMYRRDRNADGGLLGHGGTATSLLPLVLFPVLGIIDRTPGRLLAGFMAATAFLSMWISNTATTVMMIPIATSLVGMLSRNGSTSRPSDHAGRFELCLLLGIAYSASIGGMGMCYRYVYWMSLR